MRKYQHVTVDTSKPNPDKGHKRAEWYKAHGWQIESVFGWFITFYKWTERKAKGE